MPLEPPHASSPDDADSLDPLEPLRHPGRGGLSWGPDGLDRAREALSRPAQALGAMGTGALALGALAVVVLVVAVAGAAMWVHQRSGPAGSSTSVSLPMVHGSGTTTGTGAGPDNGPESVSVLVVQAAGAVARPGVYRLPAGSRVGDLIDAAGGLTPEANPDVVNLAAPLADGVRVYVVRRGEASPPGPVVDGGASGGEDGSPGTPSGPIDLNTATVAQLDTLPGVGPATAAAIVDDRRQNGPFRSVDDLGRVRGIGPAKLAALRSRVRV